MRGQPLENFLGRAIGRERGGEIALGPEYVAHFGVTDREFALPERIVRVLRGETLENFMGRAIGRECGTEIALGAEYVAHFGVSDREFALPASIARVLRGQPLADFPDVFPVAWAPHDTSREARGALRGENA